MSEVKSCPRVDIGGQAVLEGVMMKAPDAIAITVRRPDGTMVVQRKEYTPAAKAVGYDCSQRAAPSGTSGKRHRIPCFTKTIVRYIEFSRKVPVSVEI